MDSIKRIPQHPIRQETGIISASLVLGILSTWQSQAPIPGLFSGMFHSINSNFPSNLAQSGKRNHLDVISSWFSDIRLSKNAERPLLHPWHMLTLNCQWSVWYEHDTTSTLVGGWVNSLPMSCVLAHQHMIWVLQEDCPIKRCLQSHVTCFQPMTVQHRVLDNYSARVSIFKMAELLKGNNAAVNAPVQIVWQLRRKEQNIDPGNLYEIVCVCRDQFSWLTRCADTAFPNQR